MFLTCDDLTPSHIMKFCCALKTTMTFKKCKYNILASVVKL